VSARSLLCATLACALTAMAVPAAAQPAPPASPNDRNPTDSIPGAPAPPDPQREAWLAEAEQLASRYEQAAGEQNGRMRALLLREYDRRLSQLDQRYAEKLTNAEEMKRQRQLEAIALLEKFIKDHPHHKIHTPDAMYRLAALYLDEAERVSDESGMMVNADYSKPLKLWERILKEFPEYRQRGATMYLYATYIGSQPVKDPAEERRAIQVYRALVCANKFQPFGPTPPMLTREDVQQRLETTTLVDPYQDCTPVPNTASELVLYGWVRGVGAAHFATPGEMDEAIAAYSHGLGNPDHKLYDEALYMLAWSYYRRDLLEKALELFDKSVVRYDKVVAAGKKPALKLREEALQYIAVTLTDPWTGEIDTDPDKAWERAVNFYKGRENEPHVREVWATLGKAFADLGGPALDRAIDSYRKAIGPPWELNPDDPVTHMEIVKLYERKGDKEAANRERALIATLYAPCPADRKKNRAPEDKCGRWYEANETNRKAMDNYHRIGENMLEVAALTTHQQAIDKHNEWMAAADGSPEKAQLKVERDRLFNEALDHYRAFIETYPASKNIYVFTYGIAEVLFYLGRYLDQPLPDGTVGPDQEGAVRHYAWVRDHRNLSSEFFEDSIFKIVKSYELATDAMLTAGKGGLKPLEIPDLTNVPAAQPIPAEHLALQKAYDDYATYVNQADKAPRMGFNAALVSLAYYHMDDALVRLQKVLKLFCGRPEALRSKEAMLAIYSARNDDASFRRVNQQFINQKCGDAKALEAAQTQNRKLALRAATRLADENQLAEAAQAFYQYYHDAPPEDDERAAALYNAAQLYEQAGQPKRALYLYKEFSTRAESKDKDNKIFHDSPYRLPAAMLYADSYGNSYDYANAAKKYLEIYQLAESPKRYGVAAPKAKGDEKPLTFDEARRQSLFNAAAFYELDRDFDKAIKYYKRYEKIEIDRRKQDRASWAVARIYKSAGRLGDLESAWNTWRKKYGNDKGNSLDKVTSYYELAKMYSKRSGRSSKRKADDYRRATIKAWEGINWDSAKPLQRVQAAKMSGECDFYFAEQNYLKKWVPAKITRRARNVKEAKKLIDGLQKTAVDTIKQFDDVGAKYKRYTLEYMAAGNVRVGEIYLDYNSKVFNMPTPKDILAKDKKNPGFIGAYEQALTKQLDKLGYRDIAKKSFLEVVDVAKDPNAVIPKQWVALAKDQLNKEFTDIPEFPILNEELTEGTQEP